MIAQSWVKRREQLVHAFHHNDTVIILEILKNTNSFSRGIAKEIGQFSRKFHSSGSSPNHTEGGPFPTFFATSLPFRVG
eukprot:scaffold7149_cov196-Amphora_coffeaeformis.AAC.7